MILGIGNDILEIERVREAIAEHGDRFLNRLFTPKERAYCSQHADAAPFYAGRFSVKEAIVKALGSGFGEQAAFLDMEIINNELGKPEVFFSEQLKKRFDNPHVLISISHCRSYVATVAIWHR
jgi:holo-[acyl-carrier protein] synthase